MPPPGPTTVKLSLLYINQNCQVLSAFMFDCLSVIRCTLWMLGVGSGGSKGGGEDARPWGPNFLLILCSFREILIKSYPGAPLRVGALSSGKSWIRHWWGCNVIPQRSGAVARSIKKS